MWVFNGPLCTCLVWEIEEVLNNIYDELWADNVRSINVHIIYEWFRSKHTSTGLNVWVRVATTVGIVFPRSVSNVKSNNTWIGVEVVLPVSRVARWLTILLVLDGTAEPSFGVSLIALIRGFFSSMRALIFIVKVSSSEDESDTTMGEEGWCLGSVFKALWRFPGPAGGGTPLRFITKRAHLVKHNNLQEGNGTNFL